MPTLADSMGQRLQVRIHDIGISVVNDLYKQEILYISFNKSKVVWTEEKKARVKPLSEDLNKQLEEHYRTYVELREAKPDDKQLLHKKYRTEDNRV